MKGRGFSLSRSRVPLGFLLGALYVLWARPTPLTLLVGCPIALAGLLLRAVAAGHIRKNDVLATTGPYRYTRNPLYLGSTVLATGLIVAAHAWILALLAVAMLLGVYLPVIRQEERFLAGRFGAAFERYRSQVPQLLPRLLPAPVGDSGGANFSWALYLRHREYNAIIGFVGLMAVLLLKCFWWR